MKKAYWNDLKEGSFIKFLQSKNECLECGKKYKLKYDKNEGYYIECMDGKHFLDGELNDFLKCDPNKNSYIPECEIIND